MKTLSKLAKQINGIFTRFQCNDIAAKNAQKLKLFCALGTDPKSYEPVDESFTDQEFDFDGKKILAQKVNKAFSKCIKETSDLATRGVDKEAPLNLIKLLTYRQYALNSMNYDENFNHISDSIILGARDNVKKIHERCKAASLRTPSPESKNFLNDLAKSWEQDSVRVPNSDETKSFSELVRDFQSDK